MSSLSPKISGALSAHYRLDHEIGSGGMATVYLAGDLRHDRRVALKVLRPELAAVIGAERFLAEIKLTANLQHPHILPLFDSGEVDGILYYVMPYIEGESLRDRLAREKQLPVADAVRLTREVASALDYAHRHNVVHRDIKPENILLHDGSALVADFGIALAASKAGGARMTETGMSLGTPHYMSPEQAMGEREITARSDVYALGVVLYEMLTGEPPFTGPTAQAIVAKVITEKPPSLTARRETVPPEVDDAVMTALAKLPADRFGTVADFANALLPGARMTVTRRAAVRTGKVAGPMRLGLAALGGAAVSAALAGVLWWSTSRDARTADAEQRAQHSFTGRAGIPALSPDGTFLSYVERTCRHGEGLCRYALLVQEIGTNRPVPVLTDVPRIDDVRWTRDGTSLVLVGDLGGAGAGLFVLPRLGGTARRLGDEGRFDTYAAGDSALVTVADAKPTTLRVVSLETGAIGDTLVLPAVHDVSGVAWSPSGDRIALTSGPLLWLVDRRRGIVLDSMTIDTRGSVRWTARGDALLTFVPQRAREDHLVRIPAARRLGTVSIALPRVPTLYTGRFDVARRTGRLALTTGDAIQDLWAFEIQGGRATGRQLTRGTTWYGAPAISADGASAYYLRGDAVGDNLYRLRLADGAEEALTADHQAGMHATSLAVGGTVAVYGDLPESGAGHELTRVELGSRRLRHWRGSGGDNAWELPGGRLVMQAQGWSVADSFATVSRPARVPDSLHLVGVAVGPDSSAIAAQIQRGDSTILGLLDLTSFHVMRLAMLDTVVGSRAAGMSWLGTDIFLGRWRAADSLPSIWRVPARGGDLRLVAMIPAPCSASSFAIGDQGRKAICTVVQLRSDIWTVEGIGK
jgi:serine/threonine protein kinase